VPTFADNRKLDTLLESKGVIISSKSLVAARSPLLTLLLSFGPILLLIAGFVWLTTRAQSAAGGGVFSMGRSKARRYEAGGATPRITFADVAGIDEVENELVEIVDFLKQPAKYQRLGGTAPKGVLLIGSPPHPQDPAGAGPARPGRTDAAACDLTGVAGDRAADLVRHQRDHERTLRSSRSPLTASRSPGGKWTPPCAGPPVSAFSPWARGRSARRH